MPAMEQCDRIGDAGNKRPHSEAVFADVEAAATSRREILTQAIGLVIGEGELFGRNLEADVAQETQRSQSVMSDFIDIESKFRLHMLMLSLGIIHHWPIFRAEFWKLDRHSSIRCQGMTD